MRMMFNDYMQNRIGIDSIFSTITFAVLQDSGWYHVNWEYTHTPIFGYMKGCELLEEKCVKDGAAQFKYFCDEANNDLCDVLALHKGSCNIKEYSEELPLEYQYFDDGKIGGDDLYIDYCPYVNPSSTGSCRGNGSSKTSIERDLYGERVCANCRCILSTLANEDMSDKEELHSGCYEVIECTDSLAKVKIGDYIVECPFTGAAVNVTGYVGTLNCPSSDILCSNVPCINACSGVGKCVNGICDCDSGYAGEDCSIVCEDCENHCSGGQYYWELITTCRSKCPSGHIVTADTCEVVEEPIVKLSFNTQENIYLAEFSLFLGDSSVYLPEPDEHDPIASYARGLYFSGNSYAKLPPNEVDPQNIYLSYSHHINTWVRPDGSKQASLFSHYEATDLIDFGVNNEEQISVTIRLTSDKSAFSYYTLARGTMPASEWSNIGYSTEYDGVQTILKIEKGGELLDQLTVSSFFFFDEPTASSVIGSSQLASSFFEGFIASLTIANGYIPPTIEELCLHPEEDLCSINCDFNFTLEDGECVACDSTCELGCVRPDDCLLIVDAECLESNSWFDCTECKEDFELSDGECVHSGNLLLVYVVTLVFVVMLFSLCASGCADDTDSQEPPHRRIKVEPADEESRIIVTEIEVEAERKKKTKYLRNHLLFGQCRGHVYSRSIRVLLLFGLLHIELATVTALSWYLFYKEDADIDDIIMGFWVVGAAVFIGNIVILLLECLAIFKPMRSEIFGCIIGPVILACVGFCLAANILDDGEWVVLVVYLFLVAAVVDLLIIQVLMMLFKACCSPR